MIAEKIAEMEKLHGIVTGSSMSMKIHIQWAKRGHERKNFYFETTKGTVIVFENKWIIKAQGVNKFELTCDMTKNLMEIKVYVSDHREWSIPLIDPDKRWQVLSNEKQLYI